MSGAVVLDQGNVRVVRCDTNNLRIQVQILCRQLVDNRIDVMLSAGMLHQKGLPPRNTLLKTHEPPLIVSHFGRPSTCIRWWLWKNRTRVLAGKSKAHLSAGVDQLNTEMYGVVRKMPFLRGSETSLTWLLSWAIDEFARLHQRP